MSEDAAKTGRVLSHALSNIDTDVDKRDRWSTPQYVFNYFNRIYTYNIDGAADESNRKCFRFYSERESYFESDIKPNTSVWINPPYSRIKKWVDKARADRENGILTTLLLPNTPDSKWFPLDYDHLYIIVHGRLSFVNPDTRKSQHGNARGSMLIVFDPNATEQRVTLLKREDLRK